MDEKLDEQMEAVDAKLSDFWKKQSDLAKELETTATNTDKKISSLNSDIEELLFLTKGELSVSTTEGGSYVSQTLDTAIPSGTKITSFNGYSGAVWFRKTVDGAFVNIEGAFNISESKLPIVLAEDCDNIQMSVGGAMVISFEGEVVQSLNNHEDRINNAEISISENKKSIVNQYLKIAYIEQSLNGTDGYDITDFSSYERIKGQVLSSGLWYFGDFETMLFPVTASKNYTIVGATSRNWYFTLLRSADNISSGATADVCELSDIEGVKIDGKRYLVEVALNHIATFTTPSDCAYIAVTTNLGNTDCTPQSISLLGVKGLKNEIEEIGTRLSRIEEGTISDVNIVFEQGTLANANGQPYDSDKYIRNTDFISSKAISTLMCSAEKSMAVFYYDDDKNFIKYVVCPSVTLVDKEYAFFKVRIAASISDNTFFNYVLEGDKTSLLARYAKTFYLMDNLFSESSENKIKFINVTDTHGNLESQELGGYASKYCGTDVLYICTGDWVDITPRIDGVESPDVEAYMDIAKRYGIYHCMGQHECGFQNLKVGYDGKLKLSCFTHTEVFDKFIAPMLPLWNLPEESTMIANKQIYYYKDFAEKRIRLISLYQFNAPLIDDPSDSSRYKYIRCVLWYGQEQIDWLINRLNDTPEDYRVIIMLHEADGQLVDTDGKSSFSRIKHGVGATNPIMSEYPIRDIVDAFIAKSTLTKTYQGEQSYDLDNDTSDYTGLQLTVHADFTKAKASFGMYFMGDAHVDIVGKMKNAEQEQFGICTTSPRYAYDVIKGVGDKSTFVTGFSITEDFGNVYIGRIGVDTSVYMQDRSKDNF